MSYGNPPRNYDQSYFNRLLMELNKRDVQTYRRGSDVVIARPARLILTDANGVQWSVVVSTAGVLSTEAA